jgi:hypothetical protein
VRAMWWPGSAAPERCTYAREKEIMNYSTPVLVQIGTARDLVRGELSPQSDNLLGGDMQP